jgi:hypothetical protein
MITMRPEQAHVLSPRHSFRAACKSVREDALTVRENRGRSWVFLIRARRLIRLGRRFDSFSFLNRPLQRTFSRRPSQVQAWIEAAAVPEFLVHREPDVHPVLAEIAQLAEDSIVTAQELEQQLAWPRDARLDRPVIGAVKRIVVGHVQHRTGESDEAAHGSGGCVQALRLSLRVPVPQSRWHGTRPCAVPARPPPLVWQVIRQEGTRTQASRMSTFDSLIIARGISREVRQRQRRRGIARSEGSPPPDARRHCRA